MFIFNFKSVSTTDDYVRLHNEQLKYSTIFKTFNNDLTGIINKIGVFNKSFNTIGRDLSSGQGLLTSLFSGNNITQQDIQAISAFDAAMKNGSTTAQAWQMHMTGCTVAAKQQAKQCLLNKENLSELATGLQNTTLSAKAGKVALQALAMAGNMIAMWGIAEGINLIRSCANATDRLKESAKDLADELSSTRSDIQNYQDRIKELYDITKDSSSSYEESYNARKELLGIQDELIEKYGDETEVIKLITDAINGESEALENLAKKKAEEILEDFNKGTDKKWYERWGDSFANFITGSEDNIHRMVKEMEDTQISFRVVPKYEDEIYVKFVEQVKEIFNASVVNEEFNDLFTLTGDLEDVYSQLKSIKELAQNMGITDSSFFKDLSNQIDRAKDSLDNYQDAYEQYVLSNRIFGNEEYENIFQKLNNAYKDYQETFATGDEKAIEYAKKTYAKIVQEATDGITDDSVVDFFVGMHSDLESVVEGWLFEVHFKAAIDDDSDDFENDVKNAVSRFKNSEDLLYYNEKTASDEQKTAYLQLKEILREYGLEIDELISKLEKLGLISSDVDDAMEKSLRRISDDHGVEDRDDKAKLEEYQQVNIKTEEQKKLWLDVTKNIKDAQNAINAYETELAKLESSDADDLVSLPSPTDFLNKFETQYKPALSAIQSSMNQVMESTEKGIKLKVDSESAIAAISEVRKAVDEVNKNDEIDFEIDTRSVDKFADKLMNALDAGDLNSVKQAYEDFATDVVNSMYDMFGDIDETNMQAAQKALESVGILNAEAIIAGEVGYSYEDYANAKQTAAELGADLNGDISETILGLEKEGQLADEDAQQMVAYMVAKAQASGLSFDVSVAIQALAKEWEWLQDLIDQWNRYKMAKGHGNVYGDTNLGAGGYTPVGSTGTTKPIKQKVKIEPDLDFSKVNKAAKSAGKSAGKSLKDALKEELSDLESVISGITGRIDDQISSINDQKSVALDAIDAEKEALEDAKDAAVEALEAERDARLEVIEAQKEQLEAQIKLIDKQIKSKQDEIKAIEDAISTRQRELDLQCAQFELEQKMNQRTKLVKI